MSKPHKILVRAADYNGHKGVLFMMKSDDERLSHPELAANYEILDPTPAYSRRLRTLTSAHHGIFRVYPDWSLKLVV